MDIDNDGILDIISGSYSNKNTDHRFGDIFWSRGLPDMKFAEAKPLLNADGKNIINPKMASPREFMHYLCTVTAVGDINDDGASDIVVGTLTGKLLFYQGVEKEGSLTWSSNTQEIVTKNNKPIVFKKGKASPAIADWDKDGDSDLIVAESDGAIYFIENIGTKKAPIWTDKPIQLIEQSSIGWEQTVGAPIQRGHRAKVSVVDWNNDGKLDLLVGDRTTTLKLKKGITPEIHTKKIKEIKEKRTALEAWLKTQKQDEKTLKEYTQRHQNLEKLQADIIDRKMTGHVWIFIQE